jgi:hypothetical protein
MARKKLSPPPRPASVAQPWTGQEEVKGYDHPLERGEYYTPMSDQVLDLLWAMKLEHGTWRMVAWRSGCRLKQLRNLRNGTRRAISIRLLDRMITGTGVGSLDDFIWFEANDLVALGIWKPIQYVEGQNRVQGDTTWTVVPKWRRRRR